MAIIAGLPPPLPPTVRPMQDTGFEHAHSSPIKTWQQLVVVVALAFADSRCSASCCSPSSSRCDTRTDPATLAPEAVAARIQPVARVVFADAALPVRARRSPARRSTRRCARPATRRALPARRKVGDKAAWAPHIKEGLAILVKNAIAGMQSPKGVMPPRGGDPNLSDWEVTAAVVYMANQSGASFKEPPQPAAAAAPAPPAPAAAPSQVAAAAAPAAAAAATPRAAPTAAPAAADVDALLQKSGCLACHAVDKKVLGPSYKEVAAKYAGDKNAVARTRAEGESGRHGRLGPDSDAAASAAQRRGSERDGDVYPGSQVSRFHSPQSRPSAGFFACVDSPRPA